MYTINAEERTPLAWRYRYPRTHANAPRYYKQTNYTDCWFGISTDSKANLLSRCNDIEQQQIGLMLANRHTHCIFDLLFLSIKNKFQYKTNKKKQSFFFFFTDFAAKPARCRAFLCFKCIKTHFSSLEERIKWKSHSYKQQDKSAHVESQIECNRIDKLQRIVVELRCLTKKICVVKSNFKCKLFTGWFAAEVDFDDDDFISAVNSATDGNATTKQQQR